MSRSDYAHHNEDANMMWWQEEGRFPMSEDYDSRYDDRDYCDYPPDDYYDEEDDLDELITDDPTWPRGAVMMVRRGVAWYVEGMYGSQVQARMVGDDHTDWFDPDDCTRIDREDYCGECGQMGCTHDGLDRDNDNEDLTVRKDDN